MIAVLEEVARQYLPGDAIIDIQPLGQGLINDTYRVVSETGAWVLQRLNHEVFPEPRRIMDNLQVLHRHLQSKAPDNVKLRIPKPMTTLDGQSLYVDAAGQCWRALECIEPSESRQTLQHDEEAAQVGWALGHFHRLCSDLPLQNLHDTLPGFHITPDYFQHYQHHLERRPPQDDGLLFRECAAFIARHRQHVDDLETARQRGALRERVIHGDPKLNNFLFLPDADRIISLIDLDTVKPGLPHYDIGDCLRSCCRDPIDNTFDLHRAQIILRHYLKEAGAFFQAQEYDYLYPAIWLIPFELGLRFVCDHLNGNRYFKTTYAEENLHRARAQFALCDSIAQQKTAILQTIADLKA